MTAKRRAETREGADSVKGAEGTAAGVCPSKPRNFEQSIERLETIVADMEGGKLSLEEMIARFEEGQDLIRFCSGKLNEIEKKVEILVKQGDEVLAAPFEPGEGAEDGEDAQAPAGTRPEVDF